MTTACFLFISKNDILLVFLAMGAIASEVVVMAAGIQDATLFNNSSTFSAFVYYKRRLLTSSFPTTDNLKHRGRYSLWVQPMRVLAISESYQNYI
jgi:hypothetical protein